MQTTDKLVTKPTPVYFQMLPTLFSRVSSKSSKRKAWCKFALSMEERWDSFIISGGSFIRNVGRFNKSQLFNITLQKSNFNCTTIRINEIPRDGLLFDFNKTPPSAEYPFIVIAPGSTLIGSYIWAKYNRLTFKLCTNKRLMFNWIV